MQTQRTRQPKRVSRFLTDGKRLYELDIVLRTCALLFDAASEELIAIELPEYFRLEIVKP